MKKNPIMVEPDPADPEDFAVDQAAADRALQGRRIRKLRNRLGLSQDAFAARYGIPVANIRQYEIGRTMPPPAVRAYLTVIGEEPETTAAALRRAAA